MHQLTLTDGRLLAFDDVGHRDGFPVVYLPGLGDSRLARHPDDTLAQRAGLRLLCLDRPGYGESTPQPQRTTADTARDTEQLADHLGIPVFGVLGWSLGGLHALAVAYHLRDRVSHVVIVDSLGLVDEPGGLSQLHWTGSLPQRLRRLPPLQRAWFALLARQVQGNVDAHLDGMAKACAEPDQEILTDPIYRRMLAAEKTEAWKNGPEGTLTDYNTASPLGFDPGDVTQPVAVFHGAQDTIVAADAGRTLARRLPNGEFHSLDPGGHLCFLTYWTELLDTLAGKTDTATT